VYLEIAYHNTHNSTFSLAFSPLLYNDQLYITALRNKIIKRFQIKTQLMATETKMKEPIYKSKDKDCSGQRLQLQASTAHYKRLV